MLTPVPYPKLPVGSSGPYADEATLRGLLCHIGRQMHQARYVQGTSGSISARLDTKRILFTPDGIAKGFAQPDQLHLIELSDDANVDVGQTLPPGSELLMHLECYR